MWSCNASLGIEDAFDVDLCGYCGERFQANPPDWNARGIHLVKKHDFGRCGTNSEQYSSLDFGKHLRHIHHAKIDTLKNTVFMRKFFTSESTVGKSQRSSQSASNYNDLPQEPMEVAALFHVQIGLLYKQFQQTQGSDKSSTMLLQNDALANLQEDVMLQLQDLQISAARIQEQFIVDGHSFDALNMSWDLCSCMRAQDLLGHLNPPSEIDRMNLIDDIAGKDLLEKWKCTRDRINRWLLHMLRLSNTAATLIRGALGTYDLKESSEQNWIRSVLEQWSSDEASTNHDWPLMLSDGAVNSRDDSLLMFRSSTQPLEFQRVANSTDCFRFKPEISEFPSFQEVGASRNSEYDKAAVIEQFIKVITATNIQHFSFANNVIRPLSSVTPPKRFAGLENDDNKDDENEENKRPKIQERELHNHRLRCTSESKMACLLPESYHRPDSWQRDILKHSRDLSPKCATI